MKTIELIFILFFLNVAGAIAQDTIPDPVIPVLTKDTVYSITRDTSYQFSRDTTVSISRDTSIIIHKDTSFQFSRDTVFVISESGKARKEAKRDKSIKEKIENKSKDMEPPTIGEILSFGKIMWALIFFLIGFVIIRFLTKILELFSERSTNYRITIKGLIPIVRILGWILIFYIIIEGIFQPPYATIIAISASAGLAVGFASQDLLKNIFGGVMILMDRPFQVGDKIEVGNHYGEVVKIGLRSTRLVTADDSLVTVPNGDLMNQSVSNSNAGEPNCQVVAEIYLPIDIDTDLVRKIAIESAQVSKYIYLGKPIVVLFFNEMKMQKSFLKMRLKAYVADIRFEFAFKSDMTEIFLSELLKRKIIDKDELG